LRRRCMRRSSSAPRSRAVRADYANFIKANDRRRFDIVNGYSGWAISISRWKEARLTALRRRLVGHEGRNPNFWRTRRSNLLLQVDVQSIPSSMRSPCPSPGNSPRQSIRAVRLMSIPEPSAAISRRGKCLPTGKDYRRRFADVLTTNSFSPSERIRIEITPKSARRAASACF